MTEEKPEEQFEFTVIAGELKGRKIVSPDLGVTRPPLSRVRKSIFDFLVPYLPECKYLDLYSGTGAYLFEAVSRGAGEAIGVEMEERLASEITRHAIKYNVSDRLKCWHDDVFLAIPKIHKAGVKFDVVMMAPPQYKGLVARTLQMLATMPVSMPDGIILCQHDTSETKKINFFDFPILQQRKYGNTTFTILKPVV
jgi:16S rRNA (guanine966-N2)-methyltransferase